MLTAVSKEPGIAEAPLSANAKCNRPAGENMNSGTPGSKPGKIDNHAVALRVLIAIGIIVPVLLLLNMMWYLRDLLLLVFASILLALVLSSMADLVNRLTRIPRNLALALIIIILLAIIGLGIWLLAPNLAEQVSRLTENLSESLFRLGARIERQAWAKNLLALLPDREHLVSGLSDVFIRAPGVISTTLGVIGSFFLMLILGVYLAAGSRLYQDGLIRLLPISSRPRGREVMAQLAYILRWWLAGQFIAMTVIGTLTALGLWLLDIPLALTLGILAGLFNFVPYLGPILAFIPAVLIAFTDDPTKALYVIMLYAAIQSFESNILIPQIEKRVILLPPALVLSGQIAMGVLLGVFGLILAMPLAATIAVLLKMIYIQDVLGDDKPFAGEQE
jgi:predicted PurR-regulated permease PerM